MIPYCSVDRLIKNWTVVRYCVGYIGLWIPSYESKTKQRVVVFSLIGIVCIAFSIMLPDFAIMMNLCFSFMMRRMLVCTFRNDKNLSTFLQWLYWKLKILTFRSVLIERKSRCYTCSIVPQNGDFTSVISLNVHFLSQQKFAFKYQLKN